jgi:nicotinamidase-related amidase
MTFDSKHLVTPENSLLIFVDQQPQMAFGVRSIDTQLLKNNTIALAKTARCFDVPTILTSVESEGFSGYIWPELLDTLQQDTYERTTMNLWEDNDVHKAIKKSGRKKLIFSGLWTGVCINQPALCALEDNYDVYIVGDACGEVSPEAQYAAMTRAEQAGAVPITSLQLLLELQRDWSREESYDDALNIIREHYGSYGMGVDYAATHVHKHAQRAHFSQIPHTIYAKSA